MKPRLDTPVQLAVRRPEAEQAAIDVVVEALADHEVLAIGLFRRAGAPLRSAGAVVCRNHVELDMDYSTKLLVLT